MAEHRKSQQGSGPSGGRGKSQQSQSGTSGTSRQQGGGSHESGTDRDVERETLNDKSHQSSDSRSDRGDNWDKQR